MKILTRMHCSAILVVCAASATLVGGGCTDEREDRALEQIALSRTTVAFSVDGGTKAITVAAPAAWSAQTAADWIGLDEQTTSLTITAAPNDATNSVREATIDILCGTGKASVTVRQEPADAVRYTLRYDGNGIIDSEGGTFTVGIETASEWTAELLAPVDGWAVTVDSDSGICRVSAAANAGDAKSGTLCVRFGPEKLNLQEEIAIRQQSRAENPYYRFTGEWDMYASAWTQGKNPVGQAGSYAQCSIGEIDYRSDLLGMYGLMIRGSSLEKLEVDRKTGKCTIPLGYLVGSTMANGYEFYLYLVAVDLTAGKYATGDIYGTISEDGQTIRLDGMPAAFNQLGLIGQNPYLGTTFFSNLYYAAGPDIELRRQTAAEPAPKRSSHLLSGLPETLPEGIPQRLPKGMQGDCRLLTVEHSDNR